MNQSVEQLSLFKIENDASPFKEICASIGCDGDVPGWPDYFGQAITKYLETNNIPKIRTLSLFSGAGGLDIGFSDIGFDIIESVEIEQKFCETLELNSGSGKQFANSKANCIDIRKYDAKHLGKIDFIIGGPPCQTFSAAGRRANGVLGTMDARGVLFKEYVRILKELSPKGFLFENVYGIVGAQNGEPWQEILDSFSQAGYKLFYRIVDAADYGVPQHRERLIIVGLKNGTFKFPRPTHGPDSMDNQPFYNAEKAVEGVQLSEEDKNHRIKGRYGSLLNDIPPGLNYSFYTEHMGHPNPIFAWRSKFSDFLYKADPNQPVRTIKASGGAYTGPFHWDNRFFSLGEYKRLQTFPDKYEISGNKQIAIKQIGNSVPPQMARIMAIAIRSQVFDTAFPFKLPLLEEKDELSFRKRKKELTAVYEKKAREAIKALKNHSKPVPDSRVYYCSMNEAFTYKEVNKANGEFKVIVNWANQLHIALYESEAPSNDALSCKIEIVGNNSPLSIGVDEVIIDVFSDTDKAFAVAWKAFEQELIVNNLKADLVQLNGYYQYQPRLKCSANFKNETLFHSILSKVVSGEKVGTMLTTVELSKSWGISTDKVIVYAEELKRLGYEIRNHVTNPQIPLNHWLIPYSFPTLTTLSVQLKKRLQ